ncbi:MAG: histidinol-phosphatase [Ardenticatenaceae bacterium]|nr:histidinol-phosphatase [Ardenticatenaceae bacterium]
MTTRILYDTHMHTRLCKHARGEPEDYAARAYEIGLKGIIFTCHNPGPKGWDERIRMSLDQFQDYVGLVRRASEVWNGRLDVRLGLECDYVPGMEPFLEKLLAFKGLEYVLGSVHPHASYYRSKYYKGDITAFNCTYFHHLAQAAESGLFDTISHPDIVKTVYPNDWDPFGIWNDILKALDRIAKTNVAMELNTSGLLKNIKEMNPNMHMLVAMAERGIPIVVGSDAHSPQRVGANFDLALNMLEEAGYTHIHFFLDRQRQQLALDRARDSLNLPTRPRQPNW